MLRGPSQHFISIPLIAATGAVLLFAGAGAVFANAGASQSPDLDEFEDLPKAEAPMNINPDKTPVLEDDPSVGEHDAPDDPSTYTAEELADAQHAAAEAAERAGSDASFIACFGPDGLIAAVVELALSDPDLEPMSGQERDEYCRANFPGTSGSPS